MNIEIHIHDHRSHRDDDAIADAALALTRIAEVFERVFDPASNPDQQEIDRLTRLLRRSNDELAAHVARHQPKK